MTAKKMNSLQAVNSALAQAMAEDDKVLVLGEDVADREGGGVTGATAGLSTRFGDDRVKSTPISEQAIIGAAIGAALAGYKPVAEIMLMNFTTVAMDMIFNHAAKLRFMSGGQSTVPITIRTLTGAGWQTAGQHADHLEGWFAHTAGIKVVAPSTPADYKGLLLSCIQDPDPCIFIESAGSLFIPGEVDEVATPIPLGKARIVQEGTDITIISWSSQLLRCQAALPALAEAGITVELVDLRTVSPWDREAVLASVAKTGRALVVHEAVRDFGPGGEIASTIAEELFGQLKAPVRRLGAPKSPVPFAKVLEDAYIVSPERVAEAVKALMA
ncbi:alpha-ketoacid dehydrogenase subunit beta [Sphingobium yanoikuyae]|jgi:pyruvate dehydrogenase E1 component beta subunit|uniref:Alpha-ketoacid dehydrogenase subunit beta n=1 Tax=Sphingobium yanoikuyae TaxID=13690 RepID=A0A085K6M8_SPHYA|nr:transketolase C-terminal domain-containing protein [Sphingobium yanoikuyae]AYO79076.1 alpha-ketoacid dehydrogenase subunit beta [Sphingobium yanoikuyae]KFD28374.1 pyruvate dehydrogenase [Sphingobium yanoikuyae]KZC77879.1 pyruvate dehydrogenase [Sphingobium yanoikuyae]MDV3480645.1 transketolase C-terminal domain-containing protein [Sphingobium yanoikuyae]